MNHGHPDKILRQIFKHRQSEDKLRTIKWLQILLDQFILILEVRGVFQTIPTWKICHLLKQYCNNLDINLVFSSFKIGNSFAYTRQLYLRKYEVSLETKPNLTR